MKNQNVEQRFRSKVSVAPSGCWEWQSCKRQNGYGQFWLDGKFESSHRTAFRLFVGEIPRGLHVLHSCDNPSCVNWEDHLFLGTAKENTADMTAKKRHRGRMLPGERHQNAKLTVEQVWDILYDPGDIGVIAKNHGVSKSAVRAN